jgi:signal transduction histidine kinase/GAF domain-containing protein
MNPSGQRADGRRSEGTTPPPESAANGGTPAPQAGNRSAKDLAETLQRIIEHAAALLEAQNCSLAVMEPASSTLVTIASLYPDAKTTRRPRFRLNEGVAGWVAANLTPAIIANVAADPRYKETGSYPIGSMMCAPLLSGQQLLGTITVSSPKLGAFPEEALRLLEVFAEQAVFAITKARQMEEALLHTRQLEALLDVSRAMTSTLDARQIFRAIVAGLRRLVRCDDAMIFAFDEATQELGVVAVMGLRSARLRDTRIPLSDPQSLAAWVAQKRRPLLHAPGERGGMGQVTEAFLAGDDLALLAVPLLSKERLRGVVTLARATPFDSNDLRAMMNLSSIIATALENAGLYQAVKAEQERLAAIFASSSDGIALIDTSQRVMEANQSFYTILQQGPGQLLCRQVLHCDHQGGHALCREGCMILAALQHRKVVPLAEIEFLPPGTRTSGGMGAGTLQKRQVALSITPVLADQGYQALVIARDTTPLREMDRMKANFISMVSHELRSPLNAINGYLDLALEGVGGELNERLHEFIRRARSSSEHLTALVDDLLLISRADAGQFRLDIGQAHAHTIIKEALEEVELLAADATIHLAVRVAPDLPPIAGDGLRLKQVVRNLLTNAIKFTPRGGRILVSADLRAKGVEIAVQDSGRGISPEYLPRIFDRFYQVARGQGSGRGQGLGLAIVKTIVERHHGSISVESVPGEGSTFMVLLPVGADQAADATQRRGLAGQVGASVWEPQEEEETILLKRITHPLD